MALNFGQPVLWTLLFLTLGGLALAAWRNGLRWWPAWPIRFFLVFCLLVAAFSPNPERDTGILPIPQVLLIDQSDSVDANVGEGVQAQARVWAAQRENRYVVVFGADAKTLDAPGSEWPQVEGSASDLMLALKVATQLVDPPAELILASDGIIVDEDRVSRTVAEYSAGGYSFNFIHLAPAHTPNDLFLGEMTAPSSIWAGTTFALVLPVFAPASGQAEVQITVDGQVSESEIIQLIPGENTLVYPIEAARQGVITLEAVVNWAGDDRLINNHSAAAVEVFSPPRILMLTNDVNGSTRFRIALADRGVQVSFASPNTFPTNLELLEPYQVIIVQNILAEQLSLEQVQMLDIFAAQRGGGVVFLGGRNAYTLGGYQGTPLEGLLPVKLEAPPRQKRPPVTFVLVLDRSGSMARADFSDALPIDLAREAALRTIESLQAQDFLGVLTYSSDSLWTVDVQQLGEGLSLRLAQDAVGQVRAGGGTNMYQALQTVVETLGPLVTTETRHILLLSDGLSFDGSDIEFQALASEALAQNITISTIALGPDTDPLLMKQIAQLGSGRFFEVLDPNDLPRILVAESQAARGDNVQVGQTGLLAGEERHPVLGGFSQAEFPTLEGYVALTSKVDQGAEDILLSANFGDPILAAWQYGLGRIVVWTPDLGEEWAGNWVAWERLGEFWSQVVRYALPDPTLRPAQASFSAQGSLLDVGVSIRNPAGVPLNFSGVNFQYVAADGQTLRYAVPQTAPGSYHLKIPKPSVGPYRGVIRYIQDDIPQEIPAPFVIPYPIEWQPGDAQRGLANLESWATGENSGLMLLPGGIVETQVRVELENNDTIRWLLLVLVLSWPIDIGLRRRWMPWQVTES